MARSKGGNRCTAVNASRCACAIDNNSIVGAPGSRHIGIYDANPGIGSHRDCLVEPCDYIVCDMAAGIGCAILICGDDGCIVKRGTKDVNNADVSCICVSSITHPNCPGGGFSRCIHYLGWR